MCLDNADSEHQKYTFSQNRVLALLAYAVIRSVDMLPKRSTPVDQNLESESIDSQLSLAIFMASRTHLGTQECSVYEKKSKNYETHEHLYAGLVDCAIYRGRN